MGKLRQRYDNLKERYANSDVTISVQSKQKTSSSISSISTYMTYFCSCGNPVNVLLN
jgi:hypothetical protein